MDTQQNYGQCKFCSAKNVRSPKTGKIFCSEKCWLKNQPQAKPKEQAPDWDKLRAEKRNNIDELNARTNAVNIAIAMYDKGEIASDVIVRKVKELINQLKNNGNIDDIENYDESNQ